MAFQYGDLRVDQLTYTSGGANQTVTVSGLVQQVTTGGTTSGNVRIEGDLTVTGTIEGNTITGNTINAVSGNFENISGINLTYENGTISGLVVQDDAAVSGNLGVNGTITGFTISAPTSLFGQVNVITATGTTANFATGNFTNLSGGTITGDTLNVTSGTFVNISGGSITVSGITITGDIDLPSTITGVSGLFTFVSGNTVTGNTVQGTTGQFIEVDTTDLFADNVTVSANAVITGDVTATNITGTTITGTTVNATTGNFQVLEGPVATTIVTGIARIATSEEAASAVGPSGTYTDTISGDASSAFAINPSGLSSAIRAYDPPVGDSAGAKIYARVVTTTGIAPDFAISGITWSGITGLDVEAVNDEQATSAVRPSGTYGAVASGSATSEFFYNPVQLEKTFKAYDPVATAAEEQLYARVVSGVSDGEGGFNVDSYGWIQLPTTTASIATEAQAQAAAGASGTYSETPTAANVANFINPNRLRAALQAYDPGIVSGERRVYARVVSGVTDTEGDYEWLNVTDAVAGDFLPLSGGTVAGYTNFEAGLGISGNVQITGNITQTGNHTTSGTYNASRNSNSSQVLYQVNNSAGRGMYQGDHAGVAFAKGGSGVAEFTVTGDQTFGVISGDLRVGGDAQNVSDVNSSQFWALSGGQFVSAFSTNESIVWKDAAQGDILKLQSNVGGQRSDQFIFTASGDLTVTGTILARTGEFLEISAFEESNGLIRSFSGDFHDLVIGDPSVYGAFLDSPTLQVIGSGIFHSGVFFTDNTDTNAMAIYGPSSNTNGPNIVIGRPGVLEGAATRNSVAIGDRSQENASSDSDRNIAIGNNALLDMTDGHQNIAIGHSAAQNIRPGNNQGANVAIGDQALVGNSAANNNSRENVVVGRAAMFDALQARNNVAIGTQAGFNLVTVTGNVLIGQAVALNGTTGDDNVFIGNQAAQENTASGNIAIGANALQANTAGTNNTAIGTNVLLANIDGNANVAVGRNALLNSTSGTNNTAIGFNALREADANELTAVGVNALRNNTVGSGNTGLGTSALINNTIGSGNTAVGRGALEDHTTGDDNTCIGMQAGNNLTIGSGNTILGRLSGTAGMSDTILLGAGTTQKVSISGDNFTLTSADGDDATFVTSGLTANRAYTLPNQAGTIALTSDIPGGDDNLTLHNLSIINDENIQVARISGDGAGTAMFASGTIIIDSGRVNTTLISPRTASNDADNGVYFKSKNEAGGGLISVGFIENGLRVGDLGEDFNGPDRILLERDGSAMFASGNATINTSGGATFNSDSFFTGSRTFANGATSLAQTFSKAAFRITPANNSPNCINVGPEGDGSNMYVQGTNDNGAASRDLFLQPFGGAIFVGDNEIELDADGSASFASGLTQIDTDGQITIAGGVTRTVGGDAYSRNLLVQQSGTAGGLLTFFDGSSERKVALAAQNSSSVLVLSTQFNGVANEAVRISGDATGTVLVSGTLKSANGRTTLGNAGGITTSRDGTGADQNQFTATSGTQAVSMITNNGMYFGDGLNTASPTTTNNIRLNGTNGSAIFGSGDCTISDNGAFATNSTARFNQGSANGGSQILGDSRGTYIQGNTDIYFCPEKDVNDSDDPVVAFYSGQVGIGGNLKASPTPAPLASINAVDGTASFVNGGIVLNGADGTTTIFNENSNNCDFRVESNTNVNMLFVDAGNDRVGIGTSAAVTTLGVSGGFAVQSTSSAVVHQLQQNGVATFASGKVSIAASGVITASGYLLTNLPTLP